MNQKFSVQERVPYRKSAGPSEGVRRDGETDTANEIDIVRPSHRWNPDTPYVITREGRTGLEMRFQF
jgi:hypothetical protein